MLQLATFGGLRLEGSQGALKGAAAQRRPLALLALLAVAGERGLGREKIATYLWPDSDDERARGSLKQTLYVLRRDVGADGLVLGSAVLRLNKQLVACDCWEFEAALARGARAAAVALYAGPFLDGFYVPGAPDFERWTSETRADYEHRCREALEALAVEATALGNYGGAVELRRRLVGMDRLNAQATLDLMTALAAVGDPAGAIRQADVHQRLLRSELDAPPHPAVVALADRLRTEMTARAAAAAVPPVVRLATEAPVVGPPAAEQSAAEPSAVEQPAPPAAAPVSAPAPPVLPAPASPVASPRSRRRTALWVALPLVIVVLLATLAWRATHPPDAAPGASAGDATIAVLPFAVRGDGDMEYLSDGLATLLSTNLDGAHGLRSVEPRTLIEAAGGRAELSPARAAGVAARFGASLFVLGDATRAGDRVRLTAQLYDTRSPATPLAQTAVEGPASDLFALTDELTTRLLATRLGAARDRLARAAAMTTRSVPALKAYLEGERELRAGRYGPAVDAFQRAAAEDSAFALAYYRLSTAADWAGRLDLARTAAESAVRHRDRLAAHDALLVDGYLASRRGEIDEAERLYRDALDDSPDDVEGWFRLGDLLFHANPLRGRSATEARSAFERVLRLDPDDGEALMHLARIAFLESRPRAADTLVRRLLALTPQVDVLETRAFRAFALADRDAQKRVTRELMDAPGGVTSVSALHVAVYADDLVGTEQFATALTHPARSRDVRAAGYRMLARTALARGHWDAALRHLDRSAAFDSTAALEYRSLFVALPFVPVPRAEAESVRAALERWQVSDAPGEPSHTAAHLGMHGIIRLHRLGLVSVRLGDAAAALRYAAELERTTGTAERMAYARTLARSVRAHAAVAAGQSAAALEQLVAARWESAAPVFEAEALDRFTRAELLRRIGRSDEARGWYEAMAQRAAYELVYLAPAEMAQAELAAARGDRDRAAHHYRRFLALWSEPDSLLRPAVDDARRRSATLGRAAPTTSR